ncbi:MAG: tRNA (N6-threonylcarbamoyladenosine(37)-N6)-methyltransferase TrmO [Gammaproteobacteria bacterium]|nr:tRNA (N6-threonylcarbamoyladenosine(37)-N6)-methyltransferase TrmO [Gammaproteobacteria bacterium]
MVDQTWTCHPIGRIHSPLKEKFGLPRQSGLVAQLKSQLEILPPYDRDEAFTALTGYSHIWVVSVFHLAVREHWQPTVRPPRLGGNERVGVFASRAPYRPNPIGLSLCALEDIRRRDGRLYLSIRGCDLVDGTPVLDIKPYLPYADSVADAHAGFTDEVPRELLRVNWSEEADAQVIQWSTRYPDLRVLVEELIAQDPRPAYQRDSVTHEYGMRVYECNIRFAVSGEQATVLAVEPAF